MRLLFILAVMGALPQAWAQKAEPEAFSPTGKAHFSLADEKRTVEKADLDLAKAPASADMLFAAAQARDKLMRFSESIPLYTRGMDDFPADLRFPRYRGHRHISIRRFDSAVADLKRAAEMSPASFDVSYHLGLAYYLRGDYGHAAREYARCLAMAQQPRPAFLKGLPKDWKSCQAMDSDSLVSMSEWAWRAFRRAGKPEEALKLLVGVSELAAVTESRSYLQTLLLYKGLRTEQQILGGTLEGNARATIGYGVGLWHLLEGRKDQACELWQSVMQEKNWAAFGVIAAEGEIARGTCKPGKKR